MADGEEVTLDGRPLQALRVADLKAALEQRGLAKSGQKSALIKRLRGVRKRAQGEGGPGARAAVRMRRPAHSFCFQATGPLAPGCEWAARMRGAVSHSCRQEAGWEFGVAEMSGKEPALASGGKERGSTRDATLELPREGRERRVSFKTGVWRKTFVVLLPGSCR